MGTFFERGGEVHLPLAHLHMGHLLRYPDVKLSNFLPQIAVPCAYSTPTATQDRSEQQRIEHIDLVRDVV